ncbi:5,6-dimethylbenzimidazole synthase [Aliikangiella coralliicola]|uniref:5,6-dimethylbenzimidazole synthase n=1 Tax=Aliikangiella coralliicola TaxID=2592383 RepID=A0A545UFV8_9GAMM|nr:5,6-dimethylbenzimidazole synthase [Aliikangiella coralliicola]TQV88362.1 5,6-dimethylbenzimidazole synthase [Aliikangiella coralliicola]
MSNQQFSELDRQQLEAIMRARRDVRGNRFSDQPVPPAAIEKILEAASIAPSVGFSQPWEFVMVENKSTRQKIVDSFNQTNNIAKQQFKDEKQALYAKLKLEGIQEAPVNIAVFYRPSKLPVLGQSSMKETGRYSVVCAIQNMWLMARAMNIGLGWVSILDPNDVKSVLNAPEDAEFIAYLCLGYVEEFLEQPELEMVGWEERKPLESCVLMDSY